MARVFVSYSRNDTGLAESMHQWLTTRGHDVFLDRDQRDGIPLGDLWEQRLHERLRWSDAVVCLLTSAYLTSIWCTAELVTAQNRGIRLLPIRVQAGVSHPLLNAVEVADATTDVRGAEEKLTEALRRIDSAGGTGWPDDRSPYPGLRPFDTDMHRVFFGRQQEVEWLTTVLRSPAERSDGGLLLLVGPSGCGKSSLLRAGLLPAMAEEAGWRTVSAFQPGPAPTSALARELTATSRIWGGVRSVLDVRTLLDEGRLPELVGDVLLAGTPSPRTRLLIAIDQFEELLTQAGAEERSRFAGLMAAALAGPVQIVATLRPEYLDQVLADADLACLRMRVLTLRPLQREALRQVVEGPAGLAGIDVDEGLVERLVADTDGGEALPLLAYTLAQLADGVTRGGRLSLSHYEQLGGVRGTLAAQADAALAEAVARTGRSRNDLVRELLRLVTVDEQGRPARWRIPRSQLPPSVAMEFDAFVARRLVTIDVDHEDVVLGVAHEAFLSAWPPIAAAIAATSTALRARKQIEQAAAEWNEHAQEPERLWEGNQLAAALVDSGTNRPSRPRRTRTGPTDATAFGGYVELSAAAQNFLRAGIRRDRRRRRRSSIVLAALLTLALLAAGVAFVQQRAAQDGQRLATARQLLAQADAAFSSGDPRTALQLTEAADAVHPDPESRDGLVSAVLRTHYVGLINGHTDTVYATAFAPGGHTLATASWDKTVRLWDVGDPAHARPLGTPLTGHTDRVLALAFTADGRVLATGSRDKTVQLWDVSDPTRPRQLGPAIGAANLVNAVAFSPDGHTLAIASDDQTAQLWDVIDPSRPRRLGATTGHSGAVAGHTSLVSAVTFTRDGHTLITASFDRTVRMWDIDDPPHVRQISKPLVGQADAIWAIALSPDSATLATASNDQTVQLWDVRDPVHAHQIGPPLTDHTGAVYGVAFAPDGRTLATVSNDKTALMWDVRDPARPRRVGNPLAGHTDSVIGVAFAPDGRTLATAGADHTVLLWELPNSGLPSRVAAPVVHPEVVTAVAFAPDGRTMATAGAEKTVRLWDMSNPTRPRPLGDPLPGDTVAISTVAFAPDGRTLAEAGFDNTMRLWDVSDLRHPRPLGRPLTGHTKAIMRLAFAPDGRTIATASFDKTVRLWDVSDPARARQLGGPLTAHTGSVYGLAFAPDGRTLATASVDLSVLLWDVSDPAHPRTIGDPLRGHNSTVDTVAFAPDGKTLATGSDDKNVELWDVTDLTHPRRLGDALTGHTNAVSVVAFSPNAHILAAAGYDHTVLLWDVSDPAHPHRLGDPLAGHTDTVWGLAFSPDGRILATAGDVTAQLWGIGDVEEVQARPLQRACSLTGRGLTPDQWTRYVAPLVYQDTCASVS